MGERVRCARESERVEGKVEGYYYNALRTSDAEELLAGSDSPRLRNLLHMQRYGLARRLAPFP